MYRELLIAVSIITAVSGAVSFRQSNSISGKNGKIFIREVDSNSSEISFEYRISPASRQKSHIEGYDDLLLGNTELTAFPGEPAVPYISQRLIIPAGSRIDSISFIPKDSVIASNNRPLVYSMEPVIPGFGNRAETEPRDDIYNGAATYPGAYSELITVQKHAGVDVAYINLYPIRYQPVQGLVKSYTNFKTQVHLSTKESRSNELPVYPNRIDGKKLGVENPDALKSLESRFSRTPEGQYVIITNREMIDAIAPFTVHDLAAQRRSQGLSVKIVATDSIYSSIDGVDHPQKIRYFLRKVYAEWGTEYVLIAGDTNIVPVRTLYPDFNKPDMPMASYIDSIAALVPSDFYYQCLDGPYNKPNWFDKTGKYWGRKDAGEYNSLPDVSADIFIGRIPAENAIEFSNWLCKQLKYESIPHDNPRHGNIFVAGEHIGFGEPGGIMEFAKNCLNEIRKSSAESDYETKGFDALPGITVDTIFDEDRGLDNRWGFAEIREVINSNKYGVIQHLGHGLEWEYMHIGLQNVKELTNSNAYFSYSQACLPGRFINDCIGERLLTENDSSGVWGGIFNTGFGRGSTNSTDGISQRINRNFWDGYFRDADPITRVGKLNSHSHSAVFNRLKFPGYLYGIYAISLLGDPYAEIKLARPAAVTELYITAPTSERAVIIGKSTAVTWNSSLNEEMSVSLLDNGGTVSELGVASAGVFKLNWIPSAELSIDDVYRVVVAAGSKADTSEEFTVKRNAGIELLTPSEGDSVSKGNSLNISWNCDEPVTLWLTKNGLFCELIGEKLVGESHEWDIPNRLLSSDRYEVVLFAKDDRENVHRSGTFSILPGIVNSFPHTENFDELSKGDNLSGFWEQSDSDDNQWVIHSGKTPTKASTNETAIKTGPDSDHTSGTEEGKYIYVEASGNNPHKRFDMYTPRFDLREAGGAELSFWLHMFSESTDLMGTFTVDLLCDGVEENIYTKDGRFESDEWHPVSIPLTKYEGKIIQVRFRGVTDTSYSSDIALDDIEFTVENQGEVAVLKGNEKSSIGTISLTQGFATPENPVISIVAPRREEFNYRWILFDVLGDIVTESSGRYHGVEPFIDSIDFSTIPGSGGKSFLLVLKTKNDDGKTSYLRKIIGSKR